MALNPKKNSDLYQYLHRYVTSACVIISLIARAVQNRVALVHVMNSVDFNMAAAGSSLISYPDLTLSPEM